VDGCECVCVCAVCLSPLVPCLPGALFPRCLVLDGGVSATAAGHFMDSPLRVDLELIAKTTCKTGAVSYRQRVSYPTASVRYLGE